MKARRSMLTVYPRSDLSRPQVGVFSSRSPDRPDPIGLHTVAITAIEGGRFLVGHLEALSDAPILDLRPILTAISRNTDRGLHPIVDGHLVCR
jgi:tRNA (Thr-GGU) A37 N-methylase